MDETPITTDSLVERLREVRRHRAVQRKLCTDYMNIYLTWVCSDDENDAPLPPIHFMKQKKIINYNRVEDAYKYVNHYFMLGIEQLDWEQMSEDNMCCILHDLCHLPLDMVRQRLESEGAIISK